MRSFALASLLALVATPASALIARDPNAGGGNPYHPLRESLKRDITADATAVNGKAFDFVIVGGGLAGLAVASRLSEWQNVTVCVIEAGSSGDEVEQQIDVPGMSYGNSLTKSSNDWQYTTVAQTNGGNKVKNWPRGKVLGGSGAINGMFWGRAASHEYDGWATLQTSDANQTWNWAEVNKYINKAENLGTPSSSNINTFHIPIDRSAHGTTGPIHVGWSQYIYPVTQNWVPAWQALGFSAKDLAAGDTHGVTITPSTMFQDNQTRCDSKAGYIDSLPPRQNLRILTGQQVTKIIFNGTDDAEGNPIASGVAFQTSNGGQTYSVQANREVILCGGTIGSAQLLQLSGIGPSAWLKAAGVTNVIKDLPVGYNLQDHVSATMYWSTTQIDNWATFWASADQKAAALTEWQNSKTGVYTYINEAVGYVSMSDIAGAAGATTTAKGLNLQSLVSEMAGDAPASVQKGYAAQYALQQEWLQDNTGQLEVILTTWGQGANNLGIQVALQHPFSRGTLKISSTNAFTQPTIDPGYFNSDLDQQIITQGATWVRGLAKAGPLANIMQAETVPGAATTGAALTKYFQDNGNTEYHPMGTCAMQPEDLGGVVDTKLKVYGISNLRVVDASIIPVHISAHLMATTYGIAEKGADIIKQDNWKPPPPPAVSSASESATETIASIGDATDTAVAGAQKGANNSSGLSTTAKIGVGVGAGVGAGILFGLLVFCCCIRRNKKTRPAGDEKGWYAASNQDGAWDAQAAYKEQESFPMAALAAPRPGRPFSTAASVSTMATADLAPGHYRRESGGTYASSGLGARDDSYGNLNDYQRGGAMTPYRDFDGSHSPSPQPYASQGYQQQQYTPVQPR